MATKRVKAGKSAEDRAQLIVEWELSGLTRREYCQRQGIPVTTFDYWRRQSEDAERTAAAGGPLACTSQAQPAKLVRVRIAPSALEAETAKQRPAASGFVLTLRNGRRLEACWDYPEAALAKLVALVEEA